MTAPASPQSTLLTVAMGAAAGAIGVWALDRLDWFLYERMSDADRRRTAAARPRGEPPAEALVTFLSSVARTELSPRSHAAASLATHYAIGIAPAIGYALLRDTLPGRGPARAAAYGALLFALQDEGLNTITGLGGRPGAYPWQDHARGLAAHILYGVATEAALNGMEGRADRPPDARTADLALA